MLKMEEIRLKELAAAVTVLHKSGLLKEPIKVIGQPKETVVTAFIAAVKAIPGGDNGKKCPEAVSDFYNSIMQPDKKPVKAEKIKPAEKVKETEKTEETKIIKPEKVGIISTIVSSIQKKPLTKAEILEILVEKFPDRKAEGMKSTVSIQLGPTRLGAKYNLKKDNDKFHIEG